MNAGMAYKKVKRCNPDANYGLTAGQVAERTEAGAVNRQKQGLNPTVPAIIFKNTFTLFNLINAFLALIIFLVGHIENTLFIGVAIGNTLMGAIQELRAKRGLDKLSLLAKSRVDVIRDGERQTIPQEALVIDDIVILAEGSQVCADALILNSERLETDESLLTGESGSIPKSDGDAVYSGSFVTCGKARARVTAVGEQSYAHSLANEAKRCRKQTPKLLKTLNRIIIALTIVIIPLGVTLFCVKHLIQSEPLDSAVLGVSASILGMIPGGLILLTGVTMTVGALKLARRGALVQSLGSIETLARTNVLCLDKTGTITDGSLLFERTEPVSETSPEKIAHAVAELMGALEDSNSTANALTEAFGKSAKWRRHVISPFSSERKWSGATFTKRGSYVIGAPGAVFGDCGEGFVDLSNAISSEGLRVLCLAHSKNKIEAGRLPDGLTCMALLVFTDRIRENAAETFKYFARENVTIKVISGDNPRTASAVAAKAGLAGAFNYLDMNNIGEDADYPAIANEYTVFGHTSPHQKRELIRGLKKSGRTACMTGDGVNDILAMRESDCSVALIGGSEAARAASDFVLMSDDFGAMTDVLREGRRVINNIEKVASVFMLKTVYSVILTLIYIFLPYPFPMTPLRMMPVNEFTVGIPAFFMALQANYSIPQGRMLGNLLGFTLPAAIVVVINTLYVQTAGIVFGIQAPEISTMAVFLIGVTGFYLLFAITKPFTKRILFMLVSMVCLFLSCFTAFGGFFTMTGLLGRNIFIYLPLVYFGYYIREFLGKFCNRAADAYRILKEAGWLRKTAG